LGVCTLFGVSLQARLLLAFTILVIAVAGLMSYFHVRTTQRLLANIGGDLQAIGNTVHLSTQKLSAEKGPDKEKLEQFVREAAAQKNVREVHVISSHQEIVASSNPKKVGDKAKLTGKEIIVREELGAHDSTGKNLRYDVQVPIMRDQQVIGVVQTSVMLPDFGMLVREALIRNLFVALAALLLAFIASSYLLHRLNQPLRALSTAATKVAGGDLGLRLPELKRSDEAGRLNTAFNSMVERLAERRSMQDKIQQLERQSLVSEMAASLAHEIRNPLNLINLTAGHLQGNFAPSVPEQREDFEQLMASLQAEVRHLNQVVHHFLSASRPGRLREELFPLREVVDEARILMRPQFSAKHAELHFEVGAIRLRADREQIRLLLLNLLLNAVEAIPENGHIEVTAQAVPEGEGWVVLRVADTGPGVRAEDLEHVFDAYFTRKEAGVGLGLALVRRIAEEHGGSVSVSNRSEGGACFEVRLRGET